MGRGPSPTSRGSHGIKKEVQDADIPTNKLAAMADERDPVFYMNLCKAEDISDKEFRGALIVFLENGTLPSGEGRPLNELAEEAAGV